MSCFHICLYRHTPYNMGIFTYKHALHPPVDAVYVSLMVPLNGGFTLPHHNTVRCWDTCGCDYVWLCIKGVITRGNPTIFLLPSWFPGSNALHTFVVRSALHDTMHADGQGWGRCYQLLLVVNRLTQPLASRLKREGPHCWFVTFKWCTADPVVGTNSQSCQLIAGLCRIHTTCTFTWDSLKFYNLQTEHDMETKLKSIDFSWQGTESFNS